MALGSQPSPLGVHWFFVGLVVGFPVLAYKLFTLRGSENSPEAEVPSEALRRLPLMPPRMQENKFRALQVRRARSQNRRLQAAVTHLGPPGSCPFTISFFGGGFPY